MNSLTVALFMAVAIKRATVPIIPILQLDDVRDDAGQYSLSVAGNGTTLVETTKLVPNDEGDGQVLVKEGTYSYIAPEGQTITLKYVADKNGFQPVVAHPPVGPVA